MKMTLFLTAQRRTLLYIHSYGNMNQQTRRLTTCVIVLLKNRTLFLSSLTYSEYAAYYMPAESLKGVETSRGSRGLKTAFSRHFLLGLLQLFHYVLEGGVR